MAIAKIAKNAVTAALVLSLLFNSASGALPSARGARPSPPSTAFAEAQALLFKYDSLLGVASNLFDPQTRGAFVALYAWCRRADQIVDGPERGSPDEVLAALRDRRAALRDMYAGEPRDDLDGLLQQTVTEYPALTAPLFEAMLDGMETDAQPDVRYERWDALERYCYCVAGVVGEMSLPLLRVPDSELAAARAPAVALGNAVQLVNILRDIGADARLGRVYLPADELARFGVREAELLDARAERLSDAGRSLVEFQCARARALIAEGIDGIPLLPANVQFAVRAIAELHLAMLDQLERQRYDSLTQRVRLSTPAKLAVVAKLAAKQFGAGLG